MRRPYPHPFACAPELSAPTIKAFEESRVKRTLMPVIVAVCLLVSARPHGTTVPPQQAAAPQKEAAPEAPKPGAGGVSRPNDDPFPSTYRAAPSDTFVIQNATIMTAAGASIRNGSVFVQDGKI